jgi:hypothetical protein
MSGRFVAASVTRPVTIAATPAAFPASNGPTLTVVIATVPVAVAMSAAHAATRGRPAFRVRIIGITSRHTDRGGEGVCTAVVEPSGSRPANSARPMMRAHRYHAAVRASAPATGFRLYGPDAFDRVDRRALVAKATGMPSAARSAIDTGSTTLSTGCTPGRSVRRGLLPRAGKPSASPRLRQTATWLLHVHAI